MPTDSHKTREEIEDLKRQWLADPIWDIETTEGFEDYREELLQYRLTCEDKWERERKQYFYRKSEKLGCAGNTALAEYIDRLEKRIETLENKNI